MLVSACSQNRHLVLDLKVERVGNRLAVKSSGLDEESVFLLSSKNRHEASLAITLIFCSNSLPLAVLDGFDQRE